MATEIDIIQCMSNDLCLDTKYIKKLLERSKYYYKEYSIPKKNGGLRLIQQPSSELKAVQYWLVQNIINNYPVSNCAYAYRKRKSIKKNAEKHKRKPFILKVDLTDFFSSIDLLHIKDLIEQNKENCVFDSEQIVEIINEGCLYKGALTMGAVSSPAISNAVMYNLDEKIVSICEKHNYIYTRYADDIHISSDKKIPSEFLDTLDALFSKYRFKRNKRKTKFMCIGMKRFITGLCITEDGNVTIGSKKKKNIKSMIYKKFQFNEGDSSQILGYLNFIKDVEPLYYDRLLIKYSQKYGDIIKTLQSEIGK